MAKSKFFKEYQNYIIGGVILLFLLGGTRGCGFTSSQESQKVEQDGGVTITEPETKKPMMLGCYEDSDCSEGYICDDDECRILKSCNTNEDCNDDEGCRTDRNYCVKVGCWEECQQEHFISHPHIGCCMSGDAS